MLKWLYIIILLPLMVMAQTKYFLPVPIESSNGRPIQNATVAIYNSAGTTSIETCTWQDGGRYYVTDISSLPNGRYDVKINTTGAGWITLYDNIYLGFATTTAAEYVIAVDDTTELKAATGNNDGDIRSLKELASGTGTGEGLFVQVDSTYIENGSGVAFANTTAGKQWVRLEYLLGQPLNVEVAGAIPNDALLDNKPVKRLIDFGVKDLYFDGTPSDTFLFDRPVYGTSDLRITNNARVRVNDADSSFGLASDISVGDTVLEVSSTSGLEVGMWIAVWDTNTSYGYATYHGWTGKIESITGADVELDEASPYAITVAAQGKVSTTPNIFIFENKSNITLDGSGIYDGNISNQAQVHPVYQAGLNEQQRAGCNITFWKCENVTVKDLTFRDGLMHNIAFTGEAIGDNSYITIDNVKSFNGHDKCFLIRFSDYVQVTNVVADTAVWEDGLMFYGSNRYVNINNAILKNCNRFGLGMNGDSVFNATNIYTEGNTRGIAVRGDFVNITDVNMADQLHISNAYTNRGVNISNVNFVGADETYIVYMVGNTQNVTFENFKFQDCSGTAFKILDLYGGSPTQGAEYVKIIDPLFSNHSGAYFDFSDDSNIEIINSNPRPTPNFTPIGDSTKWLWRGDIGKTAEVDSVTAWLDEISDYNAIQATDTKKPLNGTNYLDFDGGNDIVGVASPSANQDITDDDYTISFVFQIDDDSTSYLLGKYQDGNDRWLIYTLATNPTHGLYYLHYGNNGADTTYAYSADCGIIDDALYVVTMTFDRDGSAQFYLNGGAITTTTDNMSTNSASITGAFNIGGTRDLAGNLTDGKFYWVQNDNELKSEQWAFDFYWYIYQWYSDIANSYFPDYTYEKNITQYLFQAPSVAYEYGDSLHFVYMDASDSVYYSLNTLMNYQGARQKVDSIAIYLNGDASSDIDSVKIIDNNYGVETVVWENTTQVSCTGANQVAGYKPQTIYPINKPLLLLVYYNVNTSVKTYAVKLYLRNY